MAELELFPELLFSVTIVVLSLGVAFGVMHLIGRLVRSYAKKTATTLDDELLPVLNWPLGVAIVLAGLEVSLLRIEIIQRISSLVKGLELAFLVIWAILGFMVAYRLVSILLSHLAHLRRESHPGLASAVKPLGTIIRLLIVVSLLFTVLNIVGVDIAPYILGWGLLGFAIVLALQPILQDLISGLYVSLAQPYKVGDKVQLPSGEICEIKDIKAQQTVLFNLADLSYVRIPNTDLAKTKVVSLGDNGMQLTIPFKLTQDSDIISAKRLATEIVSSIPEVSKKPEPSVHLTQLNGPNLSFEVVCWIKDPATRRNVLDLINTKIIVLFKEKGMRFPT